MIQSRFGAIVAVFGLALVVACQSKPSPETVLISTATPSLQSGSGSPTGANPTPEHYTLSGMPLCQGLTDLRAPLKFDWPDIEYALEKLEDYNWGYYTCAMSQPALATFFQENMPKPPYLWREVNHAEHLGGRVTLYYQPFSVTFMYIWMLPKPDTQTSYMIIARGDPGSPQTWECRQQSPSSNGVAFLNTPLREWWP